MSKPYQSLVGSLMYLACANSLHIWRRATNRDARRSVCSKMLIVCGVPEVWRSTYLKTVEIVTSADGECMALGESFKKVAGEPIVIYEDNQGAKALAKNVCYQEMTKYIDIRYYFIPEKVTSGEVELTKNHLVVFLTKGLSSKTLRYLMDHANISPKHEALN
ncbi:Retrotransposon Polyprotein [Phytophthora megakarya]|uniref:Retrotransposon Polyprotein n=1 Tax=Phytophthora megakarya TaxID=4795 RepID=A0A225X589_9STRA|nr:Retrotransposon Polyprotein [Phytophthora megakarya]